MTQHCECGDKTFKIGSDEGKWFAECTKCRILYQLFPDGTIQIAKGRAAVANKAPWRKSIRGWMGARNQFDLGD